MPGSEDSLRAPTWYSSAPTASGGSPSTQCAAVITLSGATSAPPQDARFANGAEPDSASVAIHGVAVGSARGAADAQPAIVSAMPRTRAGRRASITP